MTELVGCNIPDIFFLPIATIFYVTVVKPGNVPLYHHVFDGVSTVKNLNFIGAVVSRPGLT